MNNIENHPGLGPPLLTKRRGPPNHETFSPPLLSRGDAAIAVGELELGIDGGVLSGRGVSKN